MDGLVEGILTEGGTAAVVIAFVVFFVKREFRKFDELFGAIRTVHERVLKIEYQLPNIKDLEASILSARESKAMWKKVDRHSKDIDAIRMRQHQLGNAITSIDAQFRLKAWESEGEL